MDTDSESVSRTEQWEQVGTTFFRDSACEHDTASNIKLCFYNKQVIKKII